MRSHVPALIAALCATLALPACTSTGRAHGPEAASPAPVACPQGLPRSSTAQSTELDRLLFGHAPGWLPAGFGLLTLYTDHSAIWSDQQCREVEVLAGGAGPLDHAVASVGRWRLVADAPNGCGNYVLGTARCLDYQIKAGEHVITVQMMGIDRLTGDRIVKSIA